MPPFVADSNATHVQLPGAAPTAHAVQVQQAWLRKRLLLLLLVLPLLAATCCWCACSAAGGLEVGTQRWRQAGGQAVGVCDDQQAPVQRIVHGDDEVVLVKDVHPLVVVAPAAAAGMSARAFGCACARLVL